MKREEYNYWLSNVHNIGSRKIELLLQVFGGAEEVFRATRRDLDKVLEESVVTGTRMSEADILALLKDREVGKIQDSFAKLRKEGIYFVTKDEDEYPSRLKQIYGAPFALYIRGKLPKTDEKALAVVGARDCSFYGKEMARYLAGAVAKEGITIISGLARGIDSYAHEGALAAGGLTYGVLGCGIDICYPKENINLYMEMVKNGSIISEYAPGVQPFASNFPMRNRIISGLCDGILVIEAKKKSGSLITVDMGLDQGKNVFALPGRINDSLSEGCNNLIKMGAKLVSSPKDILEDFLPNYEDDLGQAKQLNIILEEDTKKVYASLSQEPKYIEEISTITKVSMDVLMEQLLLLELQGLVRQTRKNFYVLQT